MSPARCLCRGGKAVAYRQVQEAINVMGGEQNWIRIRTLCAIAFFFLISAGCGERRPESGRRNAWPTPTAAPSVTRIVDDACTLLTSAEIESVQGEPSRQTQTERKETDGLVVSQCFFTLPSYDALHQPRRRANRRPPVRAARSIHGKKCSDRKRLQEKESASGKKKLPPMRVADLGDEAFWVGNNTIGALHVLKGDSYLTLSVGGPEDQKVKIEKTTALARAILSRL